MFNFRHIAFSFLAGVLLVAPLAAQRQQSFQQPGYSIYREVSFPLHDKEFYRLAKQGQAPKTLFISCSDSRVIPELITNSGPGNVFVIRTAGNFVSTLDQQIAWDGVAATIEYGVNVLGVKEIIVCGHSECGAIAALFKDPKELEKALPLAAKWLRFGRQAAADTREQLGPNAPPAELKRACEHVSVVYQLKHLLSYPFVKEKVAKKEIYLHGWYFDIASGKIEYFDSDKDDFLPLG